MSYCSRCGHRNDDSAKFCNQCGSSLSAATAQSFSKAQNSLARPHTQNSLAHPHAQNSLAQPHTQNSLAQPHTQNSLARTSQVSGTTPPKKKRTALWASVVALTVLAALSIGIFVLDPFSDNTTPPSLSKEDSPAAPPPSTSIKPVPTQPGDDSGVTSEEDTPDSNPSNPLSPEILAAQLAGTYDVSIWVSDLPGVRELTLQQIESFENTYPGIKITPSIAVIGDYSGGAKIIDDVSLAPDIYCFSQDQLARLVQLSALFPLDADADANVRASNDASSVAAASVAGTLYAYPMASDNGYFMYYDTSIISAEEAESLEAIIAACEANGVKFRYALENAWYTASFFFATGCHSSWTTNEEGQFTAVDDDFNSAKGLIAMKGMQKLTHSSCYDSNAGIFTNAGVVITGSWNAGAAAKHFGANLGITDLPSFEVDGTSYHLGSFSGNKLMGVKPQTDARKQTVLSLLAQYLTNEACQSERFKLVDWIPSNKNAQASEAVQANSAYAALTKQNEYGQPQGQIHGSWWDIAKLLGADAKAAKSEADLKAALEEYQAAIDGLFAMSDEQKRAFTVIGSIAGTNWDTDFSMTEGPKNTWTSVAIEMKAGQEFKVRQGLSWDVNFGVKFNGANIVVEADGTYQVVFVWDGAQGATITLQPFT